MVRIAAMFFGVQNKRKFAHIVCIKMEVSSQTVKTLIVPVQQHGRHDVTCKPFIFQKCSLNVEDFSREFLHQFFFLNFQSAVETVLERKLSAIPSFAPATAIFYF